MQVVSLFQQSPQSPPPKKTYRALAHLSFHRSLAMASWHLSWHLSWHPRGPSLPEIVEDQTATGVAIVHSQIARMRIRVEEAILTLAVLGLATELVELVEGKLLQFFLASHFLLVELVFLGN